MVRPGSGTERPVDDDGDRVELVGHPEQVLELLRQGVPMALLVDLTAPSGPASPVILEEEGLPEQAWWDAGFGADGD